MKKHKLTRALYWQCHDLYACGLSYQAIKRIVGFSGWTIRNWLLLKKEPAQRFHAMGRPGDKTWYVDNPDPTFRGDFLAGERARLQTRFDELVDTENGPIMPGMTTRCHISLLAPANNQAAYTRMTWRRDGEVMPSIAMHRLSWIFEYGMILPWYGVYHICDNPACCNHEHLFSDRESGNASDRDSKGRGNLCAENRVA